LIFRRSIARELQKVEDQKDLTKFEALYEQYKTILHCHHYLLLLLKRHIIVLSSPSFGQMSVEELRKMKQLCHEVRTDSCMVQGHL
jgi:hypothetical protein